jgi:hypothetical protein
MIGRVTDRREDLPVESDADHSDDPALCTLTSCTVRGCRRREASLPFPFYAAARRLRGFATR